MQHRSAPFSQRWLVRWRTAVWQRPGRTGLVLQVLGVLALAFGLGYLYLGERYIYYRVPVSHFNLDAPVGKARFTVVKSKLIQRQCFPRCIRGNPDLMLIQTSATSFEEIVAYSRRLASPNDNDLEALFVRDTVPGQPWKEFARGHFPLHGKKPRIPANCLATFFTSLGDSPTATVRFNHRAQLTDLRAWQKDQVTSCFETRTNYYTDSLVEIRSRSSDSAGTYRQQVTSRVARTIAPTDAAFYSPYRTMLRRGLQTQSDLPLR